MKLKKQVMTKIYKQDEGMRLQHLKCKSPSQMTQQSLLDKESTAVTINNQEDLENGTGTSIFEDVKENISEPFTPMKKNKMIEISQDYDGWHYGLKLEASPKILMNCVVETLLELNTTYISKSSSYKITCFHHIYKKDFSALPPEPHYPNGKNPMGPVQPPVDKFAKDELAFSVRIFLLDKETGQYVVDINRTRGHTIVFLDYCQKFVQALCKNVRRESE